MQGAIARYIREGKSITAVAKASGVSRQGLADALAAAGIKRNDPRPIQEPLAVVKPLTEAEAQEQIREARAKIERDLAALGGFRTVGEVQLSRLVQAPRVVEEEVD